MGIFTNIIGGLTDLLGIWLFVIIALMNVITFIAYAADKAKAKKGAWRTPEAVLIALSFLFGSVGALLGMYLLRHKTRHVKFVILVPLSFIIHVVLFALAFAQGV